MCYIFILETEADQLFCPSQDYTLTDDIYYLEYFYNGWLIIYTIKNYMCYNYIVIRYIINKRTKYKVNNILHRRHDHHATPDERLMHVVISQLYIQNR